MYKSGLSIDGAAFGMSLGMFTIAMLVPWSNAIVSIVIFFYEFY